MLPDRVSNPGPLTYGSGALPTALCSPAVQKSYSNSLITKKQTKKFSSADFQKLLSPSYIILRIQRLEGRKCRSR